MYQILERDQEHNHAYSDFYQTDYFFLNIDNANKKVEQLSHNYIGKSFKEVVGEDEDGNDMLDYVFYNIKDCYKIVEIIPFEEQESNNSTPF